MAHGLVARFLGSGSRATHPFPTHHPLSLFSDTLVPKYFSSCGNNVTQYPGERAAEVAVTLGVTTETVPKIHIRARCPCRNPYIAYMMSMAGWVKSSSPEALGSVAHEV